MTGHRIWMLIRRIWITTGIVVTIVFVGWSLLAYRANAEAHLATISDSVVVNVRNAGVWRFSSPRAVHVPKAGLLFFPGSLVDPTGYAPLARTVAAAGLPVHPAALTRRAAVGAAEGSG